MSWNPIYALLIASSTLLTYLCGLFVQHLGRSNDKKRTLKQKLCIAFGLSLNLAILFFFKYFDFALNSINAVLTYTGMQIVIPRFDVLLPVGISFYTFQALGYIIDVYRGNVPAEKNIGKYALFVSFFPQLVAGPIERSGRLLKQIHEEHSFSYSNLRAGLFTALVGFFKKICIADCAAVYVNYIFSNYKEHHGFDIALAVFLFAVQIYCDFSGYSDIAIGVAKVLGFDLMKNFKQPYFATSIKDFWHRWHISLSTWFRDYLYIPLGGNRCSMIKKYRNLLITFVCSGLWHGANWTFVVWGGIHGVLQILAQISDDITNSFKARRQTNKQTNKQTVSVALAGIRLLKILVTFSLVCFTWVFFRADTLTDAFSIIKNIFSGLSISTIPGSISFMLSKVGSSFILFIAIFFYIELLNEKDEYGLFGVINRQNIVIRWLVYYILLFALLVYGIPNNTQTEFIYFQF